MTFKTLSRTALLALLSAAPVSAAAADRDYGAICKQQMNQDDARRSFLISRLVEPAEYCDCLGTEVTKWVTQGSRVMVGLITVDEAREKFEQIGFKLGDQKCMRELVFREKKEPVSKSKEASGH